MQKFWRYIPREQAEQLATTTCDGKLPPPGHTTPARINGVPCWVYTPVSPLGNFLIHSKYGFTDELTS